LSVAFVVVVVVVDVRAVSSNDDDGVDNDSTVKAGLLGLINGIISEGGEGSGCGGLEGGDFTLNRTYLMNICVTEVESVLNIRIRV